MFILQLLFVGLGLGASENIIEDTVYVYDTGQIWDHFILKTVIGTWVKNHELFF